jgi:hypothetical protein
MSPEDIMVSEISQTWIDKYLCVEPKNIDLIEVMYIDIG